MNFVVHLPLMHGTTAFSRHFGTFLKDTLFIRLYAVKPASLLAFFNNFHRVFNESQKHRAFTPAQRNFQTSDPPFTNEVFIVPF
jgi:hypothetical protein